MRQALLSITKLNEVSIRTMTHERHREWLSRIKYLWDLLEKYGDSECVRIENQMKLLRGQLGKLTGENNMELQLLTNKQKQLIQADQKYKRQKLEHPARVQLKNEIDRVQGAILKQT